MISACGAILGIPDGDLAPDIGAGADSGSDVSPGALDGAGGPDTSGLPDSPLDSNAPDTCADNDQDGVSSCQGDCDDRDPGNFPNHPEACGDGRDNNCNGQADEDCKGLGTFVSVLIGSDTNPG